MCGVAGFVNLTRSVCVGDLPKRMIESIRHRGPDSIATKIFDATALAHARLAILDISGGAQPMSNEDGTLWITANCEIFNFEELRKELTARGHRFSTKSDTEVILHLYEETGEDCVHKLNGQWSFAIWDTVRKRLFLSRDRHGILPLFYTRTRDRFLFASEVKALFADRDVRRELDTAALGDVFTYWFTLPPQTVFKDVYELPAGHSLTLENGNVRVERYWNLSFVPERREWISRGEEQRYSDELLHLLSDSVRLRLRADVPVGALLSGGLDSTLTASLGSRLVPGKLDTFSLTFEEQDLDESRYQREAARHLNTQHHEVCCRPDDLGRVFPDVVWHTETPVIRTAPAPMYLLFNAVRQRGCKVVLTGEGADEILGGYDIYKEAKVRKFWAAQPHSRLRPRLLRRLYPYLNKVQSQPDAYLQTFFDIGRANADTHFFSHAPRWSMTSKLKMFLSDAAKANLKPDSRFESLHRLLPSAYADWDWFARAQYLEAAYLLPGFILSSQSDRMAMGHAVESRYPFLDHRLVEFAGRLPASLKIKVLKEKYLLKHCARPFVPRSVVTRTKQPYRAPEGYSFFRNKGQSWFSDMMSEEAIRRAGIFQPGRVQKLVQKFRENRAAGTRDNMALVGILSTQLLAHHFVSNTGTKL
jgi:asparagine synthase (glutamine-hydrolysing)